METHSETDLSLRAVNLVPEGDPLAKLLRTHAREAVQLPRNY